MGGEELNVTLQGVFPTRSDTYDPNSFVRSPMPHRFGGAAYVSVGGVLFRHPRTGFISPLCGLRRWASVRLVGAAGQQRQPPSYAQQVATPLYTNVFPCPRESVRNSPLPWRPPRARACNAGPTVFRAASAPLTRSSAVGARARGRARARQQWPTGRGGRRASLTGGTIFASESDLLMPRAWVCAAGGRAVLLARADAGRGAAARTCCKTGRSAAGTMGGAWTRARRSPARR